MADQNTQTQPAPESGTEDGGNKGEDKRFTEAEVSERIANAVKSRLKNRPEIDPDKFKAFESWQADKAKADEEAAVKAGEWDKIKSQMVETHKGETTRLNGVIENLVIDNSLISAATEAKARRPKEVAELLRRHVAIKWDGDEPKAIVADASGTQRFNQKGEPFSLADLIAEDKANADDRYNAPASVTRGSGSRGSVDGDGNTPPPSGLAAFAAQHYPKQ